MADIFTPATGVTILFGAYAIYGKVISITIGLSSTTAITPSGVAIGTIKSNYIPAAEGVLTIVVPGTAAGSASITAGGAMRVRATINANTNFYMTGTYMTM